MSLANSLSGKSPADRDEYLSQLWRNFVNTEQWDALVLVINQIRDDAKLRLLAPGSDPYVRAHAAGQVTSAERLLATAQAAVTFDPKTADYSDSAPEDDDVPADTDQLI